MLLHSALLLITTLAAVSANCPALAKDDLTIDIAPLYWSGRVHQWVNDSSSKDHITFNMCKSSALCNGKSICKGDTVIGDTVDVLRETDYGEYLATFTSPTSTVFGQCPRGISTHLFFSCDKSSIGLPVALSWDDPCNYYFEWRTNVVCAESTRDENPQVPCYVYDTNGLRDLTGLTLVSGGHKVETDGDDVIFINLCRNISHIDGTCTGAVCQDDNSYGAVIRETILESVDKNTVKISYATGDKNTTINIHCAKVGESSDPRLSSSDDKSLVIDWFTSHGCTADNIPQAQPGQCIIKSDEYSVDLTPLAGVHEVSVTEGSDIYVYKIGMCGVEVDSCTDERKEVMACQTKPSDSTFQRITGRNISSSLRYFRDELTLTYRKGDKCRSGYQRDTIIKFVCNETADDTEPEFQYEDECSYVFHWHTRFACFYQCQYTDVTTGQLYDFSRLHVDGASTSWTASMTEAGSTKTVRAYMNICDRVGATTGCEASAAVCATSPNGQVPFPGADNMGSAATASFRSEPDSDGIILTYNHGSPCAQNSAEKHQTQIHFVCDKGLGTDGPQYVGRQSTNCTHTFFWQTGIVCKGQTPDNPEKCSIGLPGSDYTFNITEGNRGAGYGFNFTKPDGTKTLYTMNFCAALDQSVCNNALICKDKNPLVNSNAVSKLMINSHDQLQQEYKGNDVTEDRTVIVQYTCNHMQEVPAITSVYEEAVVTRIVVDTALACAPVTTQCLLTDENGKTFDLRNMAGTNYKALGATDGMTYFFSVCGALDKSGDLSKCGGSSISACQQTTDGHYVNLGYSVTNPTIDNGEIILHYANGATCGHGNRSGRQTRIRMVCDDTDSEPTMLNEDGNCDYEIYWRTPMACSTDHQKSSVTECSIVKDGTKYDFRSLGQTSVTDPDDGKTYYVKACGAVNVPEAGDKCKTAGVCMKDGNTYTALGTDCYYGGYLTNHEMVNNTTEELYISSDWGTIPVLILAIILGIIIVISFFGNLLVIIAAIVSIRKIKNRSYMFIVNLAVCDVLVAVGLMPISLITLVKGDFIFSAAVCDFNGFLTELLFITNIHTLMYMGVYRYIGVSSSFSQKTQRWKVFAMICASWIWGLLISSLTFKVLNHFLHKENTTQCGPDYPKEIKGWINEVLVAVTCYVIPVLVMLVVYILVFRKAKRHFRRLKDTSNFELQARQQQQKLTVTFVILLVVFLVCWSPLFGYLNYVSYAHNKSAIPPLLNPIAYWFGYLNSAINPLIYAYRTPILQGFWMRIRGHNQTQFPATTIRQNPNSTVIFSSQGDSRGTTPLATPIISRLVMMRTQDSSGAFNGNSLQVAAGAMKLVYGLHGDNSVILIHCPDADEEEGLEFLYARQGTYMLQWSTKLACPTVESVECFRKVSDGNEFDLSSLTLHNSSYYTQRYDKKQFYINVCHKLDYSDKTKNCSRDSAACMVDPTTGKALSLGMLEKNKTPLAYLGTTLVLQYMNGDPCPANPSIKMSTLITFKCNHEIRSAGVIEAASTADYEGCREDFIWETAAACPVKKSTAQTCNDIRSVDRSILNKQWKISSQDHNYFINFCGTGSSPEQQHCGDSEEFGVCQVSKADRTQQVLAGKMTTSAIEVNDMIIFNFTDGKTCAHDSLQRPRNVVLRLYCSPDAPSDGAPEFTGEKSAYCTYEISWPRPELCKYSTVCSVQGSVGNVIDLSGLSNYGPGWYQTTNQLDSDVMAESDFYMSICHPLPTIKEGLFCPPGAAVCKVNRDNSEITEALGYIDGAAPVIVPQGDQDEVRLVFISRTKCPANSSKNITSTIRIICEAGLTMGSPELYEYDSSDCEYQFKWLTNQVCRQNEDPVVIDPTEPLDCKITDSRTKYRIDLSRLREHGKFETAEQDYSISVCNSLSSSPCPAGTAVCQKDGYSHGQASTGQLIMNGDDVILQYSNGKSCKAEGEDTTWTTQIEFICDPAQGLGIPKKRFDHSSSCMSRFEWRTSVVCIPDCVYEHSGHVYNFHHLANYRSHYTTISDNYNFTINICSDIKKTNEDCPVGTSVCMQPISGGKPHALALSSTQRIQTWGEEIVLVYSSADSTLCPSLTPTVYFRMHCSNSVNLPVYQGENNINCTYTFTWSHPVACRSHEGYRVDVSSDGLFTAVEPADIFSIADALNAVMTDVKDYEHPHFLYEVSLGKPIDGLRPQTASCGQNTLACQYADNDPSLNRPIGKQDGQAYYYWGDELRLVLQSDHVCGRFPQHNDTTQINFKCSDSKFGPHGNLRMISESHSCQYSFEWELPSLCNPVQKAPSNNSPAKRGLSTGVVAAIVIAILVAVIVTIGIVYMRLRKRRAWAGTYGYSELASDNDSTLLIAPGHRGRKYDDDDDDDMLI